MIGLSDTALEWLEVVLGTAWECVVNATFPAFLLAVAVLLIQWTSSRWLRPAQLGLLWGIVLVRLMLPAAPQSAFSLQKLLPADDASMSVDPWTQTHDAPAPAGDMAPGNFHSAPPTIVGASFVEQAMDWLPLIWLIGFVLILCGTVSRYLLFAVRLKWSPPTTDPRLLKLIDESRLRLHVRHKVRTIVTDAVRQPAVMGIWWPKLLLPPHVVKLSDADLQMVLLHELAHVCRWDLAVNWVLLIVRAVHWPNPVCWLAAARFLNLREQSRDAMVLRAFDDDARHAYSSLLVTLAGQNGAPQRWRVILPAMLPGLVCGLFEKRALASRLKAIRRADSRQPVWQTALATVLLAAALVAGCTDPTAAAAIPETPRIDAATQAAMERGLRWAKTGRDRNAVGAFEELETHSYDITTAVKRIAEIHEVDADTAVDAARLQTLCLIGQWAGAPQSEAETGNPTATVRTDGDRRLLDVLAGPTAQQHVARQIAAWEQSGMAQITVEFKMVNSPIDLASRGYVEWDSFSTTTAPLPQPETSSHTTTSVTATSAIEQRLPYMTTVVPESKLRRIVDLFRHEGRRSFAFAPKITMFNGQSATIIDQTMRPFVTGVRLVNGQREPQIDVCPDGFEMQLHPVLSADRTRTQLSGRALLSALLEVQTASTQFADGPVTIQVPHVQRRLIDFQTSLRDGDSLVVACPPSGDSQNYFYLLLKPRLLLDAEIGPLAGMLAAP